MKSEQCVGGRYLADMRGAFNEPEYLSSVLIDKIDRDRADNRNRLRPPVKARNENTPDRNQ